VDDGVEGTNKMEVSSGFVSSGALSSAEEGPRGLPFVKRPIMYWDVGCELARCAWQLSERVRVGTRGRVNAYVNQSIL
jgi:hypothetical protein